MVLFSHDTNEPSIRLHYEQENGANWLYFYGEGTEKWFIGPTLGSDVVGVRIRSVALCAENIKTNEWEAYSGGEWPQQKNASINCLDDNENNSKVKSESIAEQKSDQIISASVMNDPRDMIFILTNWTEIWETSETGTRIESKNYPGGVFKTDEGYEFQLWIYPKESNVFYYHILRSIFRPYAAYDMQLNKYFVDF